MREGIQLIAAILLALVPFSSFAACLPLAPPHIEQSGQTLRSRFDTLIGSDKFRDVEGNITRWQAFLDDAGRAPVNDPELLARGFGWLAWSLDYLDRTDAAYIAATRARTIADAAKLTDQRWLADIVATQSMVEVDIGKVNEGKIHADDALKIVARLAGGSSPEASFVHSALANVAYARGQYDIAEQEWRTSADIAVATLAPENPFIVNQMASHAGTMYMVGRAEDALAENERAANWAVLHLTQDSPVITLTLGNLAVMLRGAGRYFEAEQALRRVVDLEACYQKGSWYYRAISLSNFAAVLDAQGRHEEAEALWLKAREFHAKATIKRDPVTPAYPLRFAADAAQARGDLPLALARRIEALRIMKADTPSDHPELARAQMEYATTLTLLHRFRQAFAIAEPALAQIRAKLTPDDTKRMTAEIAFAQILRAQSGPAAAYALAQPIADRLERKLLDTATARGDLIRYGPLFAASFATVTDLAFASQHVQAGFHALQLANLTDIVVVNSAVAARAAAENSQTTALVRTLQDKILNRRALERARSAAVAANAFADLARIDSAIKTNDLEIMRDDAQVDRLFPAYHQLGRPIPVALGTFQAGLHPGQVLLAPLLLDSGTFALAITHDRVVWQKTEATRADVLKLITRIRRAITDTQQASVSAARFDTAAAKMLYGAIVPAKVGGLLRHHPDLLYYTSGPLAAVPPALLIAAPVGDHTRSQAAMSPAWLIKTHAITIETSLGMHRPAAVADVRAARFLGIGAAQAVAAVQAVGAESDAAVTDRQFRHDGINFAAMRALPALDHAAAELRLLEQSIGGANNQLLLGSDANEAALRAAPLDQFTIIAFATHGLVGGDLYGLTEPALVLSRNPAAGGDDNGLLTASKIADLRLNADWVILSACNSASGSGEGAPAYGGLASAFIQAGARALLVSQWAVRDDAAQRLTVATLRGVKAGLPRAIALQRAMLALMRDRRLPSADNPAIWAPFVLIEQ
jgi:CHAT domain-containing protein